MSNFNQISKLFRFNLNKEFSAAIKSGIPFLPDWIEARIYDTGITGEGFKLKTDASFGFGYNTGSYSINTYFIKKEKNQKTENVTLRDTGDFWNSTKQDSGKGFINLSADFKKPGGKISDNFQIQFMSSRDFEKSVLSLSEKEKGDFQEIIKNKILTKIKGL